MVVEVNNRRELIEVLVDIVNLSIPKHTWLTEPQRRFFVENVLLHWDGVNISKKEGVEKLKQVMGLSPSSRQVYKFRGELKAKGWMMRGRGGAWKLPKTFQTVLPMEMNINVQIRGKM